MWMKLDQNENEERIKGDKNEDEDKADTNNNEDEERMKLDKISIRMSRG